MKFFLTLGGSIGFLGAFFSALHGGTALGFALQDGAIGCLVGAFLMRGFHRVIILCLRNLGRETDSPANAEFRSSTGVN